MATQAPEIDGVTLINDYEGDAPAPGEIRSLRITEAHDYDVVGTLLERTETAEAGPGANSAGPTLINISPALSL
jgi:ribosomal protein S12 methylthiotransferase